MKPKHQGGYSERHTELCERVLVTLLRGLGPWKKSVYLIGGLVPRYLVDGPHVGTSDVDLVLDLQLVAEIEAYRTLEQNLKNLGFERGTSDDGQRQHHSWLLVAVVLKALAYEDRVEEKDAYDLVFILLRAEGGPEACGRAFAQRRREWPEEPHLERALQVLRDRFASARHDGPTSYARFQVALGEPQQSARLRQEAFTVVAEFLRAMDTAAVEPTE